jgi:hypothetical protein
MPCSPSAGPSAVLFHYCDSGSICGNHKSSNACNQRYLRQCVVAISQDPGDKQYELGKDASTGVVPDIVPVVAVPFWWDGSTAKEVLIRESLRKMILLGGGRPHFRTIRLRPEPLHSTGGIYIRMTLSEPKLLWQRALRRSQPWVVPGGFGSSVPADFGGRSNGTRMKRIREEMEPPRHRDTEKADEMISILVFSVSPCLGGSRLNLLHPRAIAEVAKVHSHTRRSQRLKTRQECEIACEIAVCLATASTRRRMSKPSEFTLNSSNPCKYRRTSGQKQSNRPSTWKNPVGRPE